MYVNQWLKDNDSLWWAEIPSALIYVLVQLNFWNDFGIWSSSISFLEILYWIFLWLESKSFFMSLESSETFPVLNETPLKDTILWLIVIQPIRHAYWLIKN